MSKIPLALAVAFSLAQSAHAGPAAPQKEAPWEYRGQTDGVSVYNRRAPGSPIMEVKAEGTIEAPIAPGFVML